MGILTFYYLVYIKNLYTLLFLLTLITEAKNKIEGITAIAGFKGQYSKENNLFTK